MYEREGVGLGSENGPCILLVLGIRPGINPTANSNTHNGPKPKKPKSQRIQNRSLQNLFVAIRIRAK